MSLASASERRRLCGKEAPDVAAEDFSEVAAGRFGNLRHVSRFFDAEGIKAHGAASNNASAG